VITNRSELRVRGAAVAVSLAGRDLLRAPFRRRIPPALPLLVLALATTPRSGLAQIADPLPVLGIEATPIGALPPLAMPMPASRNHNYWGGRVQFGHRGGREGRDLFNYAAGVDYQIRGGSIVGLTAGYQSAACRGDPACKEHLMFGARGRFNVITSGPSLGELFNDYSATATLAAEIGAGFAPDFVPGANACTLDLGVPLSLAMLQRIRLVPYITPTVVWEFGCCGDVPRRSWFATGFGVALQQLGIRGLDAYIGAQRIFGADGYQVGISVTFIRLR
jgi:hypothetical protein